VAAGAVARQLLAHAGITVQAWVSRVGDLLLEQDYRALDLSQAELNPVRCPDPAMAARMETLIRSVRKAGDTIGGHVSCLVQGCPVGLGEPVFDRLHADLGKAVLSINACKGFEIGSGFGGASLRGSQHNDSFFNDGGTIRTRTNHAGGILGGVSTGMDIYFKAAFKPVATIVPEQDSVDYDGQATKVEGKGRHDPCVLPRAVPIVEAMTALVLADHWLRHRQSRLE
jgi:chorismate synthase